MPSTSAEPEAPLEVKLDPHVNDQNYPLTTSEGPQMTFEAVIPETTEMTLELSSYDQNTRLSGVHFHYSENCLFCGTDASDNYINNQLKNKKQDLHKFVLNGDPEKSVTKKNNEKLLTFIRDYLQEHKNDQKVFSLTEIIEEFNESFDMTLNVIASKLRDIMGEGFLALDSKDGDFYISMNRMTYKLIRDEWKSLMTCDDDQKLRDNIIESAAKIILQEIKEKDYDNESYPSPCSFLDNAKTDIPHSLFKLLS